MREILLISCSFSRRRNKLRDIKQLAQGSKWQSQDLNPSSLAPTVLLTTLSERHEYTQLSPDPLTSSLLRAPSPFPLEATAALQRWKGRSLEGPVPLQGSKGGPQEGPVPLQGSKRDPREAGGPGKSHTKPWGSGKDRGPYCLHCAGKRRMHGHNW